MPDLSLELLGPPVVRRDGDAVTFDTRKALALLAVLAVTGGEQSRERLAGLLWPESDTERARGSLRRTLSVTVAAMGEAMAVTRTTVALRPTRLRVDVADFAALAGRSDTASLDRAARIYRDDFMAGFSLRDSPEFDDWQAREAQRYRQLLAGALERLAEACLASGESDRAIGYARRWLVIDPLHEPAHQVLIRLLGATGQRSAALRQYRDLVLILDRELAVRPLPETTKIYDDVRAGRVEPARSAGPPGDPSAGPLGGPSPGPPAGPPARPAAVPSPGQGPLVGRAAELRTFDAAWQHPGGRVVAVVGEQGMGKSRLIGEFATRIAAAGGVVLSGRCHEGEGDLPFALAVDLLRSALATCPDLPARVPAHVNEMVARLLPELGPSAGLSSPADLTRLYSAAGAMLAAAVAPTTGAAAGRQAGAVIAEDVHWADGRSRELLGYLIRRLDGWPGLLIVSWQPENADTVRSLDLAVAEAAEAGLGTLIRPRPLEVEEIAQVLVAAGRADADPAALLRQTRGIPLLVREYAALPASGKGDQRPGDQPPGPVRELLGRRLRAAAQVTTQVLTTAAVLGSGCDADLLRVVSGRSETEIAAALDEAVTRYLLTEVAPPGGTGQPRYEFPYEALRTVAYESATLARARLLHGRAADALIARRERVPAAAGPGRGAANPSAANPGPASPGPAVIAGHLQRAGREDEAATWWWLAAADARRLYAHAEALADVRQAAALGYPLVEAAVAAGDSLTVLGRYREALAEYEAAAAAAPPDALLAAIEHRLAQVHHRLGDWQIARTHLAAAADLIPADDLGAQARIGADRAVVAYRLGHSYEATKLGEDALAAAKRVGDPAAVAQALNALGMLAANRGDLRAAQDALRESLEQAKASGDQGAVVASLNNLARLLADAGQAGEAIALAREALALGTELGDQHRVAALHTNLADLLHATGQRQEALNHLKEAARGFAAVDAGETLKPEVWTLVEW